MAVEIISRLRSAICPLVRCIDHWDDPSLFIHYVKSAYPDIQSHNHTPVTSKIVATTSSFVCDVHDTWLGQVIRMEYMQNIPRMS